MSGMVAGHYIGKDSNWLAYVATGIALFTMKIGSGMGYLKMVDRRK